MEKDESEERMLEKLMALPSTPSEYAQNRLLNPSEYKKITPSKASVQSIKASGSFMERMLKYADKSLDGSNPRYTGSGVKNIPNLEKDIVQGRLFLEQKGTNNISIWSHLNDILRKILSERPDNVIEYFEEYSRQVKQERFNEQDGFVRDIFTPPEQLEYSKKQLALLQEYKVDEDIEDTAVGEEDDERQSGKRKMDLIEAAYFFSQAGVHLPDSELFAINVAMKKFIQERPVLNPRFWGKVLGSKSNYFIIECQLPAEEAALRNEEEEAIEIEIEEERKTKEEEERAEKEMEETDAIREEERIWLEAEQERAREDEERLLIEEQEKIEEEEKMETKEEELEKEQESMKRSLTESKQEGRSVDVGEGSVRSNPNKENDSNIDKIGVTEEFLNAITAVEESSVKLDPLPVEEDPLLPPLPKPKQLFTYKIALTMKPVPKIEPKIPTERYGEGVNKKVFFVCSEPGEEWVELPRVTPKQIIAARQLKIYFTGNLDAQIDSFPEFPGTEKNFLRAQIARISAGTQVSPLGFYSFSEGNEEEEEVEEEEEEGDRNTYVENSVFEPVAIKDLVDPTLAFWVHHTQHILKQGRAIFWSTKKPSGEEEEEEEAEEEEEEDGDENKEVVEVGPPLLTPLSEDASLQAMPPWTLRKSSYYNQANAVAVIRSNLWPGACAFAVDRKFENIYIGEGHKYSSQGFSPAQLPHPEYEYLLGPEILEMTDPSVEIEEAWRQKHKKKPPLIPEEEGEEEENDDEEEEEDDE